MNSNTLMHSSKFKREVKGLKYRVSSPLSTHVPSLDTRYQFLAYSCRFSNQCLVFFETGVWKLYKILIILTVSKKHCFHVCGRNWKNSPLESWTQCGELKRLFPAFNVCVIIKCLILYSETEFHSLLLLFSSKFW